jgi:hypothetical protein
MGSPSKQPGRLGLTTRFALGLERVADLMVEEGLWTANKNGRKRMALLDVSGSKTLDARVFKVREELQERYPEHAIDIRLCKYSKLGELIGKLNKVLV